MQDIRAPGLLPDCLSSVICTGFPSSTRRQSVGHVSRLKVVRLLCKMWADDLKLEGNSKNLDVGGRIILKVS